MVSEKSGSSPRVRGGPQRCGRGQRGRGLIPASAGRTSLPSCGASAARAHPRECGADSNLDYVYLPKGGSSPRVRGGRLSSHLDHTKRRLIPASAGRTLGSSLLLSLARAHPRECGADSFLRRTLEVREGSSPRVRGGPGGANAGWSDGGLIPASAGRTRPPICRSITSTAHPRECGADMRSKSSGVRRLGSSPRVRGGPFATSNAAPIERVKEPTSSSHLLRYPASAGSVVAALSLRLIPAQQGHTRILVHLLLIHISLYPISERWAFGIHNPQTSATLSN